MPSTYTVNLGIEKPATGEQSGTWGDTTNVNFDILDQAINGAERVTLTSAGSSGSPNTLQISNGATSDGRNKWIEFYSSSDLGGSAFVQLDPNDAEKIVFVRNSLAGSQSVLLFQGTYDAGRDLEIPAGVDMVVKFDGGGASAATVTDVFTKLRATEITTPTLTAGTADINGGTIDNSVIGGSTAAAVTGTTVVANTSLNIAGDGATVTGIKDEDDMSSDSPTKLATQQSIKAYVDSQVGTVDTWAEVLANGATSGSTNPEVTAGQALKTNTINETSAGSGVTIDSVLLKDDVVNATDVETGSISANDGTAAATIANTTGNFTITNFISNSVDIGGGAIDGTNIGASSAATGAFTTLSTTSDATLGNDILMTNNSHIQWGSASSRLEGNSSGTDTLKLYTNSTENLSINGSAGGSVVVNEGSSNLDFRVESTNNANMLFVDAGTDRVGVGTNAPVGLGLTVNGGASVGAYFYGGTNNRRQLRFTSFDTASLDAGHEISASSVSGRLILSASSVNHLQIDAVSNTTVFNEDSTDQDFRVESDSNTHMVFVDAGANHVNIGTSTDLTGVLNVDGNVALSGAGTGSRYVALLAETNTYAGRLVMQAGGGSAAYGGSIVMYGHSHASNGGDVVLGISSGSGGQFRVHNNGVDTGADRLTIGENGDFVTFPAANNAAVFNQAGVDADFRVESNSNANMLFVDAGSDQVKIGTSGSGFSKELFVQNGSNSTSLQTGIEVRNTSLTAGSQTGIVFTNYDNMGAKISSLRTGSSAGHLQFWINSGGGVGEANLVNTLQIKTADTVFNEIGWDRDFRVESDALSHCFFVDASENGVGIGDGTVLENGLRIQSSTGTTNAIDTKLYITARSSGTTTTGFGPGITFAGERNGDSNIQQMAKINAIAEVNSGTDLSSGLSFQTATAGTNSEKLRISNAGYLIAQGASQVRLVLGSTGNSSNNTSNWIRGNGSDLERNTPGQHKWEVNGTQVALLDGDGLRFGTDTSTANALDDYEVGTWTLVISGESGGSVNTGTGYYKKIGNFVYCAAYINQSMDLTSLSGLVNFSIPFSGASWHGGGSVVYANSFFSGSSETDTFIGTRTLGARVRLVKGSSTSWITVSDIETASGSKAFMFEHSYQI